MSMPPSGSDQCGMDEEAIIEAEIQFELDNINLDNDPFVNDGDVFNYVVEAEDVGIGHDFNISEYDDYVKRIQDQTNRFEQELQECDELLLQSNKYQGSSGGLALIPYEDQHLLGKLAGEFGCTVEEYKRKILEDIEQDNFEIKDELAEFMDDDDTVADVDSETKLEGQLAITDGQADILDEQESIKLGSEIDKAVQEGIDPSEVPVSQDLLPVGKKLNGTTTNHLELQQMLREQLEKLESRYEERLEKMKKDEAFYKNEEEVQEKRLAEERLWKKQELERKEKQLKLEQELQERKIEEEKSQRERQLREEIRQFEILEDIEQDNFEIKDELAEFMDDDDTVADVDSETKLEGQLAITDGQADILDEQESIKLGSEIDKAVQEGIDPSEVPVSQDLLPVGKKLNGTTTNHLELQQMLREQLEKLESRYEERLEKMKKDEAFYKNEEEVQEKRLAEERLWKKQELERKEKQLKLEQELQERKIEEEKSQRERQLREEIRQFEKEMADLQAETEKEKKKLERNIEIERQKQIDKQNKAALIIQKTYRGHRVRQISMPSLVEKRENRLKEKEEKRIREVEQEIYIRNEEKKRKEEEERMKKEEEKKKQEEIKRQKELEKQQKEEEKRKKKEEEERKKQEEKQRKEEEKQRKKEEERKKKEEEKKRKEEEEKRKKEEKRLKEEQERQRKEEEKLKREEEKRRKEEEKKLMEEERKRKIEEEKKRKEEVEMNGKEKIMQNELQGNDNKIEPENIAGHKDFNSCNQNSDSTIVKSHENGENVVVKSQVNSHQVESDVTDSKEVSNRNSQNTYSSVANGVAEDTSRKDCREENQSSNDNHEPRDGDTSQNVIVKPTQSPTITETGVRKDSENKSEKVKPTDYTYSINDKNKVLEELQKSGHIPHPPSPRKTTKTNDQSKVHGKQVPSTVDTTNLDCLPELLECLRLKFMKECQPWSKVSNEPWKLKTGLSRKPLRRPSSAKKLPLLPDTAILQAARVASLQQVTTVQLCELPGNNISPLGQCLGLKYLSVCNCNLVALDGLGQCKQLQYIDVRNNKLEFIDLKDVGQLQYLNVSHNRLSSIHGVDSCSSLRWIDLSYNNITKLGGLETLRRLNTLILSHNQLINADGLGATPTLQMIDMSHNHLQDITDLDKLCLLLSLDLSSNNLLKIPNLQNQVLLQDLNLSDNSISTIEDLSTTWLPLLNTINLSQNSLDTLPSLHNCLTLKKLDLSNNQITEFDTISKCIEGCLYLEYFILEDNPVMADFNTSHIQKLETFCPRLHMRENSKSKDPVKPRTSFEMMCLTQSTIYRDMRTHFDSTLKSLSQQDLALLNDSHHKYCEKLFNTAVEHRYAHEYGEINVTMPSAPVTPKSGRPKSGRQKDSYASPKDLFENALKASSRPNVGSCVNDNCVVASQDSNPKDLFDQTLKSTDSVLTNKQNQYSIGADKNGIDKRRQTEEKRLKAIVTIQAYWRGWLVRHEIAEHTRIWLAATVIQACWRGYSVRKQLKNTSSFNNVYKSLPPAVLQHLNKSATKIQAIWRGYNLRRKLLAALEYAQCNFDDEEDEDAMMFGDDFDLDKFVALDQNLLDEDWKPPDTPDIPSHHAVLKKPPSGRAKIPPIALNDVGPPNNPRRAWRNTDSPLTDVDKISRPPSSVASTDLTARTHVSKKEERITEEWGFKDTTTAHLMVQRAKKMKYNAERRNKISKLDPKQRLALFRKLEEVTHPRTIPVPQRKTLPRKEYFKARQQEIYRQEQEKQEEYNVKASRTFEWLHTQVGDHEVSDSVINKGYVDGPSYVPQNFPELHGIRRVQLTQSPGSLDLQSIDSVSSASHKPRRASLGTAGSNSSSKLPPIQTSSAPTQNVKERMSFRNPRVNQSVGWGGGKKRGSIL